MDNSIAGAEKERAKRRDAQPRQPYFSTFATPASTAHLPISLQDQVEWRLAGLHGSLGQLPGQPRKLGYNPDITSLMLRIDLADLGDLVH